MGHPAMYSICLVCLHRSGLCQVRYQEKQSWWLQRKPLTAEIMNIMFIDDIERIDGREINEMLMGLSLTPSWHMIVLNLRLLWWFHFFQTSKLQQLLLQTINFTDV